MSDLTEIQKLERTLKLVSENAPRGSRIAVAEKLGISPSFGFKVRAGGYLKNDNKENRKLLKSMIDAYSEILEAEELRLKEIRKAHKRIKESLKS